jgi:hypothetical protein
VLENVRWLFSETLRLFWQDDREKVAGAIRELLQFDVPAVGRFEATTIIKLQLGRQFRQSGRSPAK